MRKTEKCIFRTQMSLLLSSYISCLAMCVVALFSIQWTSRMILICFFISASVACAVGPSVTTSSTDFSFQNLVFWGIYLNFQQQKSHKNQSLPHSESKSYQIDSLKSCSSGSFQQQHQRHIPIPLKFFSYALI